MRQIVVSKCAELPQVILQSSVLSQRSQIFLYNLVFLLEIFLSKQTARSFFFPWLLNIPRAWKTVTLLVAMRLS